MYKKNIGIMKGYLLDKEGRHMLSDDGTDNKKIYVPLKVERFHPDVPYSIYIGRNVAVLVSTCPITYKDVGIPVDAQEAN